MILPRKESEISKFLLTPHRGSPFEEDVCKNWVQILLSVVESSLGQGWLASKEKNRHDSPFFKGPTVYKMKLGKNNPLPQ